MPWDLDSKVTDVGGGLFREVLTKIDVFVVLLHVLLGDVFDPVGNSG